MLDIDVKAAPLAVSAGLGESFVRDILRGKTKSPSAENMRKLAAALNTSAAYLTGESDELELTDRTLIPSRGVPYRGEVAAGIWAEVGEGVIDPDDWLPFNPIPQFPEGTVYCLRVRGDSLDKIARPGTTLVCVNLQEAGIDFKDGDLVIVARTQAQGGLIETTAKRVRFIRGGYELVPESTNPKWQPIVVMRGRSPNDDHIQVIARVEFILNKP